MLVLDPPLVTSRLVVRPFREGDVDEVHAMRNDDDVIRYIPWTRGTREQAQSWLADRMAEDRLAREGDNAAWAVERREDGRLLGSVNAWWRSERHQAAEVGFAFAQHAQGQGYASEAMTALLDALFDRLPAHRVTGRADARNTASARLMSRLGMRHEATHVEDELFKGEWVDTVIYAVLDREWAARRR